MDPNYQAELAHALRSRARVFLIRNLLCAAALLAGGVYGIMELTAAQSQKDASAKSAKGGDMALPPDGDFAAFTGGLDDGRPARRISGGPARLLPLVADRLADRPLGLTRNPADGLPFNREWEIGAPPPVPPEDRVKPDPGAAHLSQADVVASGEFAGGYVANLRTLPEVEELEPSIPAAAKQTWLGGVAKVRSALQLMNRAGAPGSRAAKNKFYSDAKELLREAYEVFNQLRDEMPKVQQFNACAQFVMSAIHDCNKSMTSRAE